MTARWKGFTRDELARFGVQTYPGGWAVPYRTPDGKLHRTKFIPADQNRDPHWIGARKLQVPYGLETLRLGGSIVFLTEGESDAWALRDAYPNTPVLGLPGAASWQPGWAFYVRRFPRIYLSFDADDAGRRLVDRVWPDLPGAHWVELPQGMDTRDVLQRHGSHVYRALVARADAGAALRVFLQSPELRRQFFASEGVARAAA